LTVTTTLAGAVPPPNSGTMSYEVIIQPTSTCTGCFGGRLAADLNNTGAQNKETFTYSLRTYTCANNVANVPGSYDINGGADFITITGSLVSTKVNVTVADTNPADSGGANINVLPRKMFNMSTGVESGINPPFMLVDLLHTGLRTGTLTATSGATGADSLTALGANQWFQGNTGNVTNAPSSITNGPAAQCPVVSVEWITND
jgi:hypothetical protein